MFTTVADQPANEYMDIEAAVGHLLIVRPQRYQDSGFKTEYQPDGTDVVFCDVADLDMIDGDTGKVGKVFRGNSFLQGYLKGTFKRYVGHTLIGVLYFGPKEKGRKPPYMWHDLSGDAGAVMRGQQWMAANPDFLVAITPAVPEAAPAVYQYQAPAAAPVQQSGPPVYQQPAAPAVHQSLSTLQQLKAANAINAQGQPQTETPPF